MNKVLEFRWTVSRGRETYGYNICSLWVDNSKVASCTGGGYDMAGTCLGEWMASAFLEQLKKLRANYGSRDTAKGFYGLRFWRGNKAVRKYKEGDKVALDGGCGFESMRRILNKIGYTIREVASTTNRTTFLVENK